MLSCPVLVRYGTGQCVVESHCAAPAACTTTGRYPSGSLDIPGRVVCTGLNLLITVIQWWLVQSVWPAHRCTSPGQRLTASCRASFAILPWLLSRSCGQAPVPWLLLLWLLLPRVLPPLQVPILPFCAVFSSLPIGALSRSGTPVRSRALLPLSAQGHRSPIERPGAWLSGINGCELGEGDEGSVLGAASRGDEPWNGTGSV